VRNLIRSYEARELVGYDHFVHVQAWLNRGLARSAVQRGSKWRRFSDGHQQAREARRKQ